MTNSIDWLALGEELKEHGIELPATPVRRPAATPDSRLRASFEEITRFVEEKGRKPDKESANMPERNLAMRLSEFRCNPDKANLVRDIDRANLLPPQTEKHPVTSLSEIFGVTNADDTLGILDTSGLPKAKPRKKPDYVTKRKPCADFEKFEHLFKQCQDDLLHNRRHLTLVAGKQGQKGFGKGCFAVVSGVLCYVAEEIGETSIQSWQENKRLRVIFENGTESSHYLRSLFRALYNDGYLVSRIEDDELSLEANEDEKPSGIIYVLKSKSKNPAIMGIPNLYKIGVSSQTLRERIANAANEPTYLMADVTPIIKFKCYDIATHQLESILHRVFADCQVVLDVTDKNGTICHPREWFSVPFPVIRQVIQMIKDGSIKDYHYDKTLQRMVEN